MNHAATATICVALCATALADPTGEAPQEVLPADETRMSVEIPLEGPLRVAGAELLRVNDLLDERTEFHSADFRLDELVLVARSEADTAGEAELLVMDWRSGEFDIPAADQDEWYEVRIPAPDEELGGAWLLDLVGDVTVDMLVAVLEPTPNAAAKHSPPRTRTVYRVVDGRPATVITRWVHSPARYHVYHYHHGWPYRYFWGPWHYNLVYRPHYRHQHWHRQAHHTYRDGRRHHRKLRRIHPRARVFVSERHAPRRAHSNRHVRNRTVNPRRPAASERARTSTRSRANRPARHDVARPLPKRRDYARAAPSRSSGQSRGTSSATPTAPRAQAPRRGPERATPRQRNVAPRSVPRPTRVTAQRDAPTRVASRRRDANPPAHRVTAPRRAPQRATPRSAPAPRDFVRSPSRQPVRTRRPVQAPTRTVAEVRPRTVTAQPRPPTPAAPRRMAPPERVKAEPSQTDAPRSRRPSRDNRPERRLR